MIVDHVSRSWGVAPSRGFGCLVLFMVIGLVCGPAIAKYGGGAGTQGDPYLIYTPEQMNAIGTEPGDWAGHFKLMADIDLGQFVGEQFNIIGGTPGPFTGVFDGNGHTISNFTYTSAGKDAVGLFGRVGRFNTLATIRDLDLIDPNIAAGTGEYVGSLAGLLHEAVIENCLVLGGRISGRQRVGGLVGGTIDYAEVLSYFPMMQIRHCHATAEVTGTHEVGGLIGYFEGHSHPYALADAYGLVSNCSTAGKVSGQEHIGGLAGVGDYLVLSDCYSQSCVSGSDRVGGLLGASEVGVISRCYASGPVTGTADVGGLLGVVEEPFWEDMAESIEDCYWDLWQSGQTTGPGGLGRTTAQMKQKATFVDWDFDQVWDIAENQTYPFLRCVDATVTPSELSRSGRGR